MAGPSRSGANVGVEDIFLSHSGKQKCFVEHLYDALQRVNHKAFIDKHSLPKGSPFPDHIVRAALGCKLGVVVLTEDFLTAKWPMLELEMLVLQRGDDAKVLPLCYMINFEYLKCPENIERWRPVWKEKGGDRANDWEEAVRRVAKMNGEIYKQGSSEAAFIQMVVQHIWTLVPCHVPYDMSLIQGHKRLAKEVAGIFDSVKARNLEESACMVGLHAVGGLGKTTFCQNMVNLYTSEYYGRSCLIQFPSDGADKQKITKECKRALTKLTNLSQIYLSEEANSFDQVVHLMEEHVSQYNVFLAIDNVWESSWEEAKRLLNVGFSATSKILLTSRSEEVLKDLLRKHKETCYVGPLPAPNDEEAFLIFQETSERDDLKSLLDVSQIERVLEACRFSGSYHPIALKGLGQCAKKADRMKDDLFIILEEMSKAGDKKLQNVIKLNYDILTEDKKHIFLDIVTWLSVEFLSYLTYARAHQWLGFVYRGSLNKSEIGFLISDLASDGLIQFEPVEYADGELMIVVHDLFVSLAQEEAAKSPRFLTGQTIRSVEEMGWEKLKRVFLRGQHTGPYFVEKLQQQERQQLQVLDVLGMTIRNGSLQSMPCLSVLKLTDVIFVSEESRSAAPGVCSFNVLLFLLSLCDINKETYGKEENRSAVPWMLSFNGLPFLSSLCVLQLKRVIFGSEEKRNTATGVLNLCGLVQLEILEVGECDSVKRITGLDALKNLQALYILKCTSLTKLEGLSGLVRLQHLRVWQNTVLANLDDLSGCISLTKLDVDDCHSLERLPDLDCLTCLQELALENMSLKEVGCLSATLTYLFVYQCPVLKKLPDVSGLIGLEQFMLWTNEDMEEVGGVYISPTLKILEILEAESLRSFPSLIKCLHLQKLMIPCHCIINDALSLKQLPDLRELRLEGYDCNDPFNEEWKHLALLQHLVQLEDLTIVRCGSIIKLEVGCLSNLESLFTDECEALEEIGDVSGMRCLSLLSVEDCPSSRKVSGLADIATHLNKLWLLNCESLEESSIPDVHSLSHLKSVTIKSCGNLQDYEHGVKSS